MAQLTVPSIDFSPLGQLGQVYKQANNERKLSDLGRMLADGSVDYRAAAGQVADMGDINSTLKFLALSEQEKNQKAQLQAGTQFNQGINGMFGGGQPSQPASPPPAVGVPSLRELRPQAGPPVASAPKVWGDDEGVKAGIYDAPKTPGARPPAQVAANGISPVAAAPPSAAEDGGIPGPKHLPFLFSSMTNPNMPAGQKEAAKLLVTQILGQMKPNERGQYLELMKSRPDLLEIEKGLKAGTTVNVDTKGETELSKTINKGLGERINKIAEDGDSAQTDLAMVGQLRDLGAVIKTGLGPAIQGKLAEYGIKVGENVGAIEAYSAILDKMTPAQRIPGSGASSDFDAKMFKGSLNKLINTPEGNAIIANTLAGVAQYKLDRAIIAERVQAGELSAKDSLKLMRDLPNPYENFKNFAKAGFKADSSNPASAAPPQDSGAAKQVPFTKFEIDQSLSNARSAIQANPAAKAAIIKKLRDNGLPTDGL